MKIDMLRPLVAFCLMVSVIGAGCRKDDAQPVAADPRCHLKPGDLGICQAYIPRFIYDEQEKRCKEFIWGGCAELPPFETLEECQVCLCNLH